MIYALLVVATLLLSTAIVVLLIKRAPLVDEVGNDGARIEPGKRDLPEAEPDAATSVGAN